MGWSNGLEMGGDIGRGGGGGGKREREKYKMKKRRGVTLDIEEWYTVIAVANRDIAQ